MTLKRIPLLSVACGLFLCLQACDFSMVLRHQSQVKPGETMDVTLGNMFMAISETRTFQEEIKRNGLRVAIGLPAGWSVVSVKAYTTPGSVRLGLLNDETPWVELLDSANAHASQAVALQADPSMEPYFRKRSFSLDEDEAYPALKEDSVEADSVPQWKTFSHSQSLIIPQGTSVDTFTVGESFTEAGNMQAAMLKRTGEGDPSFDSLGIKYVPVYIYVQLRAGTTNGNFKLYYYSKTDSMPPVSDTSSFVLDFDTGDMSYFPVEVTPSAAINNGFKSGTGAFVQVSPLNGGNTWEIRYRAPQPGPFALDILDLDGRRILHREFPFGSEPIGALQWNKPSGLRGKLVATLRSAEGSFSRIISLSD